MELQTSFQEAQKLHEKGQLDNAYQLYNTAIEAGESVPESWNYIGLIHYQKNNIDEAINIWKKAIDIKPGYIDPLLNCGVACMNTQLFDQSELYLKKAHQIDQNRPETVLQLAQLYIATKRPNEAIDLLKAPAYHDSKIPEVYLILAKAHQTLLNWTESINWLEKGLVKFPNHPFLLLDLAEIKAINGSTLEAEDYFQTALANNPGIPLLEVAYGKFCVTHDNIQQGVQYLQQGLNQLPQNWEGWLFLGNGLMELGHLEDAIKTYEHAKQLNPNHIGIQQQLARAYGRFVPPWHAEMMADIERNDAYQKAIEQVVGSDSIVFEIGTGSGLLSLMAARAGAKQVYGCEVSPHLADITQKHVEINGYSDSITVFNAKSTSIEPSEFKEKPDVIVAEIFDSGLLGEHAIPSFRHAIQHLCKPNCTVIPRAANIKARLIHIPSLAQVNPPKEISGFDLSEFSRFIVPREYKPVHLSEYHHTFCSEEVELISFEFESVENSIPEHSSKTITKSFQITSDLPIHGVAFWFDLDLAEGITLRNYPERKNNHWGQAIFFFNTSSQFEVGKSIDVNMHYNDILIRFDDELTQNN